MFPDISPGHRFRLQFFPTRAIDVTTAARSGATTLNQRVNREQRQGAARGFEGEGQAQSHEEGPEESEAGQENRQ